MLIHNMPQFFKRQLPIVVKLVLQALGKEKLKETRHALVYLSEWQGACTMSFDLGLFIILCASIPPLAPTMRCVSLRRAESFKNSQ
jgi:hypothetical protein